VRTTLRAYEAAAAWAVRRVLRNGLLYARLERSIPIALITLCRHLCGKRGGPAFRSTTSAQEAPANLGCVFPGRSAAIEQHPFLSWAHTASLWPSRQTLAL
jgi:hypothetical protein